MKKLIAVALCVSLGSCASAAPAYDTMADSVVKIEHDGNLCAGVIYDAPRGLIVTNKHCVQDIAGPLTVTLRDGAAMAATVVGESADVDIAVVHIDTARPLRQAGIGAPVDVGDTVFTLGHPLGLEWSLSKGIVSYVGRVAPGMGTMVQIDAAVNPGNSGGALYDDTQHLVGINTASRTKLNAGLGFAIPIAEAMRAAHAIEAAA